MSALQSQAKAVGYLPLIRQNKQFRLLWFGQIVSLLGDWFNLIASASLIAVLTQSGVAIGGLFVVRMLAPFLVSPFAGVAADRYNRKQLLILTDIMRAVIVLGFLFVREPGDVWLIYVLTGLQMALQGFFFPARNAILPDITSKEELGTANTLSSATWSVMLAFGAALGGFVSGAFGAYPAFIIDALTFLVSGMIIARMLYQQPPGIEDDKTVGAALRQYVDGLRYLWRHVDVLVVTLHKGANSLFVAGAFQVLQVEIAERIFVIGESGGISLGLMFTFVGIGTGLGPVVMRYFTGDRERALRIAIALSYGISACGLLIVSTLASFPVVLFGALLRGVGAGTVWVFSTQLLLQLVPVDVRGRVFSTEFATNTLMAAIAAGSTGALIDTGMGIHALLRWMAGLVLLPALLWTLWILLRKPKVSYVAE